MIPSINFDQIDILYSLFIDKLLKIIKQILKSVMCKLIQFLISLDANLMYLFIFSYFQMLIDL